MNKILVVPAIALLSLGLVVGCGSSSGNGNDAGGTVSCDAFPNVGTAVTPTADPAAPPAMTGGALTEGIYALTSFVHFNNGSSSTTHKETFVFSGGIVRHAESQNGGAEMIVAGTYSTSGTAITLNVQCPQAMTYALQYTATASTFVFLAPNDAEQVQTYTLQ